MPRSGHLTSSTSTVQRDGNRPLPPVDPWPDRAGTGTYRKQPLAPDHTTNVCVMAREAAKINIGRVTRDDSQAGNADVAKDQIRRLAEDSGEALVPVVSDPDVKAAINQLLGNQRRGLAFIVDAQNFSGRFSHNRFTLRQSPLRCCCEFIPRRHGARYCRRFIPWWLFPSLLRIGADHLSRLR
jgi:hypothetical protein